MKKLVCFLCLSLAIVFTLGSLAIAGQPYGGNGNIVNVPQKKNPRLDLKSPAPQWGIIDPSIVQVSAFQFMPYDSSMVVATSMDNMRYRTNSGNPSWLRASLNLPSGAKIEGIEIYGCDENSNSDPLMGDIYAWLYVCSTSGCTLYGDDVTNGTPAPACDFFFYDLSSANITVDNFTNNYFIEVGLMANDNTNRFQAFNVYYTRQISPAPSTATFSDVPTTHPFFQEIEALAASGITTGYPDGTFKPNNYVTRQALAAYLARALGLHWPF